MNIPKIDQSKALEKAARFKDITDRARAARPVEQGADILKGVTGRPKWGDVL